MKLTYEKNGDYLIPNLMPNEEPEQALTKYGLMRKKFLQEHRKGIYQGMVLTGELKAHCLQIQEQAEQRMDFLTQQMAKSRGSGRGTESSRSDEMGGTDEQHQTFSGGNRADGADLQLENSTQQNKEQQEPDSENNSLSGSFDNDQAVPNEDVTGLRKGILCSDEFLIHKRPEIAGYFAMEQDTRLQTEYFRNCFPFGTYYALDVAGTSVGFHAGEEGLYINMTGKAGAENETLLSWEDARFLVNSYMEDGVYLLPGEVAEQIDMDGMYKQLDLFTMFSEQVGNIAMKQAEEVSKVPPAMPIPQEQLDAILRSGGGRDNSRKRIYAKYCQGKTPEEMAEFLKRNTEPPEKALSLTENRQRYGLMSRE